MEDPKPHIPDSMFRQVAQTGWVAIVFSDVKGIITFVNDAASALYQYEPGELIGQPSAVLAAAGVDTASIIETILQKGGWTGEMVQKKKDGTLFTALLAVWLTYDALGNPNGMSSNCIDITERKTKENETTRINIELEQKVAERTKKLRTTIEELEASHKERETAFKELESFSYSVSHDLKAPLRAVRNYSQLLGRSSNEEDKLYLEQISRNIKKMTALIDDLLELARAEKTNVNNAEADINALVETVIAELQSTQPEYHPLIWVHDLHSTVTDINLLKQVYINLISNAMKYSSKKDKPMVEIGESESNGEAIYFVRDNGEGFDMKYKSQLFQPFQRLHGAGEFPGNGVGLTIVRKIINKLGGRVWADAKPGEGATFYFTLHSDRKAS